MVVISHTVNVIVWPISVPQGCTCTTAEINDPLSTVHQLKKWPLSTVHQLKRWPSSTVHQLIKRPFKHCAPAEKATLKLCAPPPEHWYQQAPTTITTYTPCTLYKRQRIHLNLYQNKISGWKLALANAGHTRRSTAITFLIWSHANFTILSMWTVW